MFNLLPTTTADLNRLNTWARPNGFTCNDNKIKHNYYGFQV